MAVQRRVAAKDKTADQPELQEDEAAPSTAAPAVAAASAAPSSAAGSIQPRVAINIGLHSLLMLVLPLGLFFASSYGLLDREFRSMHCCCCIADIQDPAQ